MHHNIPYLPSPDHSDDYSEYSSSVHTHDATDDEYLSLFEDEDEDYQEDEEQEDYSTC